MFALHKTLFNGTKYRNIIMLGCIFPFIFFMMLKEYNILRIQMMLIHSYGAFVAGLLFFYEKRDVSQLRDRKGWIDSIKYNIKYLDIELTIIITFINQILLYFFHPAFVILPSILLNAFLLLFLIRQLRIPIKNNIIFLTCYGLFYFILSFKFVKHSAPSNYIIYTLINYCFTISLTILFAYVLLAISKSQNIYRNTFLSATAMLCLAILGRRIMWPKLNNAFIVAHVSSVVLMSFSYLYWYDYKECYIEIIGRSKKIFNIGILPNLVGALTFFLYIYNFDINGATYVWLLIAMVFIWYSISMVKAVKVNDYLGDDAMICNEMTTSELKRLSDYALHLRATRLMKDIFFTKDDPS